jgi:hypothetical protein
MFRARTPRELFGKAFDDDPLRVALGKVYDPAMSIYLAGDNGARGYFIIGTAVRQAMSDPDTRAALVGTLRDRPCLRGAHRARSTQRGIVRGHRSGKQARLRNPPFAYDSKRYATLASELADELPD